MAEPRTPKHPPTKVGESEVSGGYRWSAVQTISGLIWGKPVKETEPAKKGGGQPAKPPTPPSSVPPPTVPLLPNDMGPYQPPAKPAPPKKTTTPPAKSTTPPTKKATPPTKSITPSKINNSEDWAHAILAAGKYPDTPDNVKFLVAFAQIEGGNWNNTASYNVIGTTVRLPGSHVMGGGNSAGVQAYTSWDQGVQATIQMFRQGNMSGIDQALKSGKAASTYGPSSPAYAAIRDAWDPGEADYTNLTKALNQAGGPTVLSPSTYGKNAAASADYTGSTVGPPPGGGGGGGGGGGPSPVITPNGVNPGPPIPPGDTVGSNAIKSFIKQNYPTYAWMLDLPQDKTGKGLMDTIETALKEGISDSQVQARIGQTQWWLTTTTAQQQYEQMKYTTPEEFKLEVAQAGKVITDAAANQGVHFPPNSPQLNELVQEYMQFGWGVGPGGAAALRSAIQGASQAHGVSTMSSAYLNAYLDNPSTAVWTGGAGEKGFEQGLAGQSLTDAAVAHVRTLAGQAGVKLSNDDLIALGTQVAMQGMKDDQVSALINNWSTTGHGQVFTPGYMQLVLFQGEQLDATGNDQNPAGSRSTVMDQAIYQVQQLLATEGVTGLSFGALRNAAQLGLEHGWVDPTIGSVQVSGGTQGPLANYLSKVVKNGQGQQYSPQYIEAQLTKPWVLAPPTQKGASNQYSQVQNEILNTYLPSLKLGGMSKANLTKATDFYLKYLWGQPADQVSSAMSSYLPTLVADQSGAGSFAQAYSTALGENNSEAITFTPKHDSGNLADTAWHAVRNAIAGAGKVGVSDTTLNDLATQYMEHYQGEAGAQDWLSNIGPLVTGKGVQNVSVPFAEQLLANPSELWPTGGYAGTTSASTSLSNVLDAAQNSGYTLPAAEILHLTYLAEQGKWDSDATQLKQNIGDYAKANNLTWTDPNYLLGQQDNPTAYHFPKDWATYQADLDNPNTPENKAVQMVTMAEQQAGQSGVNLSYAQAVEVAKKGLKSGITTAQGLDPFIAPYVKLSAGTAAVPVQAPAAGHLGLMPQGGNVAVPPTPPVNTAPSVFQQLRGLASQYFQNPNDQALQTWAQKMVAGTQTQQQFETYLAQQAADRWPGFGEQLLNQNMNMDQATSNLQQLVSQTLELPQDQSTINLAANPQYAKLLDGGFDLGKDGQKVSNGNPMTSSQAVDYLQTLPQWQYTRNAHAQASDLTTQILQLFGKVS